MALFSALIPGVLVGGMSADYFGGYKGKGMMNALTLCCIYGFFASIFSLILSVTFEKTRFIIFCWFFYFFGACIMPISSGIIISCVPKHAQNSASAFYGIFMNILGLSLAPVISGHIMEQYTNKKEGMIHGYRILLYAGPVLLVLFIMARSIVLSHLKRMKQEQRD